MRFKQPQHTPPQIDLIPMLNVMMGILAFFVMITMSLSSEETVDVDLPGKSDPKAQVSPLNSKPFVVELGVDGQILLNTDPIEEAALQARIETYLQEDEEGTVYLKPDYDIPYEQVMQFLGRMRAIGGDRVSLAIDEE